MNPTIIFVVVALAAGASANPWGWGAPQPPQDNPDVAHARAAHLAIVARQNGAALAALAAANARSPGAWAGPAPVAPVDTVDVALAKGAHLAEHARQTGAALSALAAANARAAVAPQAIVVQAAPQALPVAPSDNVDVAIAKAAHLAEHARQTGNALAALSGARVVATPLAWAPVVAAPQALPVAPSDTIDVSIAKAAHLAEVARQNGAALSALAAAQARAGWGAPYHG